MQLRDDYAAVLRIGRGMDELKWHSLFRNDNAYMAYALVAPIGALKQYQVSFSCFGSIYPCPHFANGIRGMRQGNIELAEYIIDKSGTIKARR